MDQSRYLVQALQQMSSQGAAQPALASAPMRPPQPGAQRKSIPQVLSGALHGIEAVPANIAGLFRLGSP